MTKNHWAKQILFRNLNKNLAEVVKNYLGQVWTPDLKNTIRKLALKFMNDNNLADDTAFTVVLEKDALNSINGTKDIFRGIKLV